MGFSRQEYWSGLPFASPGDLPDPGTEPASPALQTDSLLLSHWGSSKIQCRQYQNSRYAHPGRAETCSVAYVPVGPLGGWAFKHRFVFLSTSESKEQGDPSMVAGQLALENRNNSLKWEGWWRQCSLQEITRVSVSTGHQMMVSVPRGVPPLTAAEAWGPVH